MGPPAAAPRAGRLVKIAATITLRDHIPHGSWRAEDSMSVASWRSACQRRTTGNVMALCHDRVRELAIHLVMPMSGRPFLWTRQKAGKLSADASAPAQPARWTLIP